MLISVRFPVIKPTIERRFEGLDVKDDFSELIALILDRNKAGPMPVNSPKIMVKRMK